MAGKKDLYSALGVAKSASQEDIRAAYRKLAKDSHPDLHPGDTAAEDRFKTVSAAYDILGDPDKRKRYDNGEIDETGADVPPAGFYRQQADGAGAQQYYASAGFDEADLGDIFADLFGHRGPGAGDRGRRGHGEGVFAMRGSDVQYTMAVDLPDVVVGAKKRISLPDGRTLDVSIPQGIADGKTMRLKGRGMPGLGAGEPGDVLITVHVRPHKLYRRIGNDIHLDVPISLKEAILGGQIDVPTVTGTVKMSVPKGSNSGAVLRLKGKGVKTKAHTGDQFVKLVVTLPENPDQGLNDFIRTWAEEHDYDPRQSMREVV